jgi:uncharacterized protein
MLALALADQVNSSRVDLEALETFLMSDRAPLDSMMLSDLDGFLTGIAVGPELVPSSEWLPMIWGGETPEFIDHDEASAICDAIMARYHEIVLQIADERCEPIFWVDRDGAPIAFAWADGFLKAIMLRVDAWERLFKSEHLAFLLPILALCSDEAGKSLLGLSPDQDELLEEPADVISESVIEIAAFWRGKSRRRHIAMSPVAEPMPTTTKVGRNEPCPCGSGKKFKKCCSKGV